MIDEKIDAFLTQFKSLDALGLSLIEELRIQKARNIALTSQLEEAQDTLAQLRNTGQEKESKKEECQECEALIKENQELKAKLEELETKKTTKKSKSTAKSTSTESIPSLF